jgi:anti-sigma factor RsiW
MMIDPAASGPDAHLDPDQMADLYDGLLDHDAAEAAREHLASCTVCADDFALITMDSSWSTADSGLAAFAAAGLATPAPIPVEVAIRVEAALHREPPLTPLAAPTPAPHHSATSLGSRRTRRFRLIGGLAGATLVIAGAFAGITALNAGGESQKNSTTSASGFSSRASDQLDSASGDKAAGVAPNAAPSTAADGGAVRPQSGTSALSVEAQAEQLLEKAGRTQPQVAGSTGNAKPGMAPFACSPAGFQNSVPLGMTAITYQGQSAELLVYPKPGDPTTASVYVVALTGCTAPAAGEVLYTTEVHRP